MSTPCQKVNRFIKYYHAHKEEIRERRRLAYAANREVEVAKRRQRYAAAPAEAVARRKVKEPCPHCGVGKHSSYVSKHALICKQRAI
jgi:hypothetical protein